MAGEGIYQDIYQNEVAPAPPRLHSKRTVSTAPLLAVLVLLLGISLVAVAVLYSQKERTLQELEGLIEKLCNVSYAPGKPSENLLRLLSSGWKFHNRSWYFFSEERRPWEEAEKACVSLGAHLTSVTSRKEMEYLSKEAGGTEFWIGLNDQREEGRWTWVDGTRYSKDMSFWAEREPNSWNEHDDCVEIRYTNVKSWSDENCTNKYNWICKLICP